MEPKLRRTVLLASDIIYLSGADCLGLGWVYLSKAGMVVVVVLGVVGSISFFFRCVKSEEEWPLSCDPGRPDTRPLESLDCNENLAQRGQTRQNVQSMLVLSGEEIDISPKVGRQLSCMSQHTRSSRSRDVPAATSKWHLMSVQRRSALPSTNWSGDPPCCCCPTCRLGSLTMVLTDLSLVLGYGLIPRKTRIFPRLMYRGTPAHFGAPCF